MIYIVHRDNNREEKIVFIILLLSAVFMQPYFLIGYLSVLCMFCSMRIHASNIHHQIVTGVRTQDSLPDYLTPELVENTAKNLTFALNVLLAYHAVVFYTITPFSLVILLYVILASTQQSINNKAIKELKKIGKTIKDEEIQKDTK